MLKRVTAVDLGSGCDPSSHDELLGEQEDKESGNEHQGYKRKHPTDGTDDDDDDDDCSEGKAAVLRHSTRVVRSKKTIFSTPMRSLFVGNGVTDRKNLKRIYSDPPIYVISNFLSESELVYLDQLRNHFGQLRSFTQNPEGERVVSEHRTSTFTHLRKFGSSKVRNIERRAAEMLGMPVENVEPLQVVRYKEGQQFGLHHDCTALLDDGSLVEPQPGRPVRMATFFVYLNTVPQGGGGETAFPLLDDLEVRPVRGSAVLFCNLLEDGLLDPRVVHEARRTMPGVCKFGMNIWVSSDSMLAYAQSNDGIVLSSGPPKPLARDAEASSGTRPASQGSVRKRSASSGGHPTVVDMLGKARGRNPNAKAKRPKAEATKKALTPVTATPSGICLAQGCWEVAKAESLCARHKGSEPLDFS